MAAKLGSDEVHVWAARLDQDAESLAMLGASLCPEERARAERFRFPQHRNRFIAGRGLLRNILAAYLDVTPSELQFSYGPFGKPDLNGKSATGGLHFNLAHCEDLAVFALTRSGPIGVDVERVRPLEDAEDLVNRFFSPAESAAFHALAAEVKPAAFFNLWTRKEAWLKATGEGIAQSLNKVEVSFIPGEPARLLRLPAELGKVNSWSIVELTPAADYTAALALQGGTPDIRLLRVLRGEDGHYHGETLPLVSMAGGADTPQSVAPLRHGC